MPKKFQVGDRVKVTKGNVGSGRIGKIKTCRESYCIVQFNPPVRHKTTQRNKTVWLNSTDLAFYHFQIEHADIGYGWTKEKI